MDPNRFNYSHRYQSRMNQQPQHSNKPDPVFRYQPKVEDKKESFFASTLKDTWKYILSGVLVPSIRSLFDSIITGAKDKMLWDKQTGPKLSDKTNYAGQFQQPDPAAWERNRVRALPKPRWDQVPIPTKEDANNVLNEMYKAIVEYGRCTVAYTYFLMGMETDWTEDSKGWTSAAGFDAGMLPDGQWHLILPEPKDIRGVV